MSLRFVSSAQQLKANMDAFIECTKTNPDLARDLIRRGTYMVVTSGTFSAAPTKFCAFEGMTAARYTTAHAESGVPFNGLHARTAIETLLGAVAESDPAVLKRFVAWVERRFPGVCKGIDTGKWCFVTIPPRQLLDAAIPPTSVLEDSRMTRDANIKKNWPNYAPSQKVYAELWYAYNDVLYNMCAARARHATLADVVAKVGIIGRAYATQLERHATKDGDGAIVDVATALYKASPEIDARLDALRIQAGNDEALDIDTLAEIVRLHAWVSERVSGVLRGEHASPSFVSKYLHFHLPAVPIYDSRARTVVNGFYPAYGKKTKHLPRIRGADPMYYDFCNRFWSLWSDATRDRVDPSTRRLDQYLLYCHDMNAWGG